MDSPPLAQMKGIGAFMLLLMAAAGFILFLVIMVISSVMEQHSPTARAKRRAAAVASSWAAGICPVCGYEVKATPDRCPECGTPAPAKALA